MKNKTTPAESEYYRKLGKKSAAARKKRILEKASKEAVKQPVRSSA